MKRPIVRMILIVCLVLSASTDALAVRGHCFTHVCPCTASAPGVHADMHRQGHHHIDNVVHCGGATSCCHLKSVHTAREPLLVHATGFSAKQLSYVAVLPVEEKQPWPCMRFGRLLKENTRPGPNIPAYLQNLALLC